MPKALMPEFSHADKFHLQAAVGWLELGSASEAFLELDNIEAALRRSPEVQGIYWQIWAKKQDWLQALQIAETLCQTDPANPRSWLHKAVALYRLQRTEEAWDTLLPKVLAFPTCWMIPYDLSCYACQLGKQKETMDWLLAAMQLHDRREVKRLALSDPDLQSRWPEIERL